MPLGLYDVSRGGRRCLIASPTISHAREDAELHLGGRPTGARRIGTAGQDIARGVVIPATEQTVSCGAVGPSVIAAALQGAGFMPRQAKERVAFVGRLAAWVVLHEVARYSSVQIGALTGHHHSTVLHALAVAEEYAQDDRFKAAYTAATQAYAAATE